MCYRVIIKKTVFVDADSPAEAEELALDVNDLFGADQEVISVKLYPLGRYYCSGG